MKPALPLVALGAALCLSSCFAIKGSKHTYVDRGKAIEVGGAMVEIDFRPEGTRPGATMLSAMVVGGGWATFDGPFQCRIEAHGKQGLHQSLIVHRIRTRTETTKRDEWFPAKYLGEKVAFKPQSDGKQARARYLMPGLLEVKPEEDGGLTMWVDLTIVRATDRVRRTVQFRYDPTHKKHNELVFLPVEVATSIGKDFDDMEDSMWD